MSNRYSRGFTRCRLDLPWSEAITLLPEGRDLLLRPIRKEDAAPLRDSFALLSPEDVRFRFLHVVKELTPEAARRLCDIDPAREFALVVAEPAPPGRAAIGAVARAVIADSRQAAEFSIIVGQVLRGHGLASHLMRKIITWSKKKSLPSLYGDVLADNTAMLELARGLGFQLDMRIDDPGLVRVTLNLK